MGCGEVEFFSCGGGACDGIASPEKRTAHKANFVRATFAKVKVLTKGSQHRFDDRQPFDTRYAEHVLYRHTSQQQRVPQSRASRKQAPLEETVDTGPGPP